MNKMDGFQRRREQKKVNILEAALALFMEYGVQKISVAEIAKKAMVSQVTIYNYFESKHNLVREVFLYYIDKATLEFEQTLHSDIPFPEKIKQLIFTKKEAATQIHEDFYQYLMEEYTGGNYIEEIYVKKAIPLMMELFEQGRKQGYVDPNISNEAIIFFIQALHEYIQKEEVYPKILPMTEEIMKLLFYGMVGKGEK